MTTTAPSISDFDPGSPEFMLDPGAAVQNLLAEAPVFFYEPLNAYFVLPYEDVRRVIGDDETYLSHAYQAMPVREDLRDRISEEWQRVGQTIMGGQTINLDPPEHTYQRKAMQQAFTRRRVEATKPAIMEIASELIEGLADRGSCDVLKEYAMRLTLRVVGTMVNLPPDMMTDFQAWIINMLSLLAPIDMKPEDVPYPDDRIVEIYEQIYGNYVVYAKLLEDRRADPGDDLCSAMLALRDEDGTPTLTNDQVLTHMIGITTAGTDTTANLIVNLIRYFTESPDQLQLVRDDPSLWDNAVLEGLRRGAVSTQLFRISTRETEIAGVKIPARSNVIASLAAANADPAKFPDPLRFDVRRENAADHLGLGRGRHFCLGAPLAPPEARIAVQALYNRLPDLKADLDQQLEFLPTITARVILSQRASWSV